MSSLIPFNPDPGQASPASGLPKEPGMAGVWTPESAKLRDLDANGVTAALTKLLGYSSIAADLRGLLAATKSGEAPALHAGDRLVLIGGAPSELGGSVFLEAIHGSKMGEIPAMDPDLGRKIQKIVGTLTTAKIVSAVRTVAGGGLLVAVVEMLLNQPSIGAKLDVTAFGATRSDTLLFGESRGRVVVAVSGERVGTVLSESHTGGVPSAVIGTFTGELELALFTRRLSAKWPVAALREAAGLPIERTGA